MRRPESSEPGFAHPIGNQSTAHKGPLATLLKFPCLNPFEVKNLSSVTWRVIWGVKYGANLLLLSLAVSVADITNRSEHTSSLTPEVAQKTFPCRAPGRQDWPDVACEMEATCLST